MSSQMSIKPSQQIYTLHSLLSSVCVSLIHQSLTASHTHTHLRRWLKVFTVTVNQDHASKSGCRVSEWVSEWVSECWACKRTHTNTHTALGFVGGQSESFVVSTFKQCCGQRCTSLNGKEWKWDVEFTVNLYLISSLIVSRQKKNLTLFPDFIQKVFIGNSYSFFVAKISYCMFKL